MRQLAESNESTKLVNIYTSFSLFGNSGGLLVKDLGHKHKDWMSEVT